MRAEDLVRALHGRWFGSYGTACCPAHDDGTPSLSIQDGDSRLLLFCHAGCAYRDIVAAIRETLSCCPISLHVPRSSQSSSDMKLNGFAVDAIWSECRLVAGTRGEAYLRARCIVGELPETLRFHPTLRHPSGARLPAMVARIDRVGENCTGLHRTFLDASKPTKTELSPAKAMLGRCAGGAVRLRTGSQGLVVAEGIETALSLCDAIDGDFAVWAALSTAGMSRLVLPPPHAFDANMLVAMDGDEAGHAAGKKLADCARRSGWMVETISAPQGLDFNDVARGLDDE